MTKFSQQSEQRIDLRVDKETKTLAERASAALGCRSLTEYLVKLIRENAPKTLSESATIQLNKEQFDHFIVVCDDPDRKPGARILEAAKKLDEEGF